MHLMQQGERDRLAAIVGYLFTLMHCFSFWSTRENVVPALVEKCLGAMKAGTKQKATDIILLYAEIDTPDPVVVRISTRMSRVPLM